MGANERSHAPDEASQRAERPQRLMPCAQLWRESFRELNCLANYKGLGVGSTAVLGIDVRCVAVGRGMILRQVAVGVGNTQAMKLANSRGGASGTMFLN